MRLQKRLTWAAALVIAVVAIAIGSFAVLSSYATQLAQIESRLWADASAVKIATKDPLSTALVLAGQTDIPIAVGYVSADQQLTTIEENGVPLNTAPSSAELKRATSEVISFSQDPSIRIRSVALNDEDYVVFAADTQVRIDERNQQLRLLFFVSCIAVLLAVIAVNWLIRRDIKQIEIIATRSTQIASGDLSVRLPESQGRSEIDELTQALNSMVDHLTRLIEQEKVTQRAMQDFLSDASHELRTPLTVVRGYIEILDGISANKSEQEQRAFARIHSELMRMSALVDDLLLLAELGESDVLAIEEVDFSKMVNGVVDDLQLLNPKRVIECSVATGVIVMGSGRLISQLLSNLIGNIVRHTPEDAQVNVALHVSHGMVKLTFEDAGPGLPESAYGNPAHHFQRFDKSRSRKTGGSGLGMSIMNAVAAQHSGELELSRSPLGGLRTEICLPLRHLASDSN